MNKHKMTDANKHMRTHTRTHTEFKAQPASGSSLEKAHTY